MKALSIVFPNGTKIAKGEKLIEVRSWQPNLGEGEDLLIVENEKFLREDGEFDEKGRPVALVKIHRVRKFTPEDVNSACASRWEEGYYSWELKDVRPVFSNQFCLAKRGLYELDLNFLELSPSVLLSEKAAHLE